MKTIQDFTKEVDELIPQIEQLKNAIKFAQSKTERQDADKKARPLIAQLNKARFCITYLKTNPSETFVNSEIQKLKEKITKREDTISDIKSKYPDYVNTMIKEDLQKVANLKTEVNEFRTMLRNLKLIMD